MHSTLMLFYSSARWCRYACIIAMFRQDVSIVGYYLVRFFLYGTALHRSATCCGRTFSFLLLSALLKTDFALTLYYAPVVLPCVLSCSCLRHWFVVRKDSSRSCVLRCFLSPLPAPFFGMWFSAHSVGAEYIAAFFLCKHHTFRCHVVC